MELYLDRLVTDLVRLLFGRGSLVLEATLEVLDGVLEERHYDLAKLKSDKVTETLTRLQEASQHKDCDESTC